MSGGGGEYYVPPVRRRVTVSCETLVVVTVLVKPNEELIAALKIGQVLTVHSEEDSIYVMFGDQIAGYIETPQNGQIIECMAAGTFYVAEIKEIEGTKCTVEIYAPQL